MHKEIPSLPTQFLPYYRDIRGIKLGFGYDSHDEEYKFVRILDIGVKGSIAEVYAEGSNTWKQDQLIPYSFTYGNAFGVLMNETLHWIAYHCSGSETRRLILSFSISDESYGELPLPENVNDDLFRITVGALEADLCIIDYCVCMLSVDVWVMKDYGVNGSWSKLHTIPLQAATPSMVGLKLLHSFNNGEILLKRDKNTLLLYHPQYNETKIVKIRGVPDGLYDIMTFVGSLFSVNSGNCLVQDRIEIVAAEPRKKPKNFIKGLMSIFKCFSG
ncbi:hypothetical protein C5167_040592 [Papaver somniferum]|uniref:F-box associated beta-propeller type 1 domain-containing protein n=2 Tax=Papaver somniferum TaxID=3469 RepID=A0A4Y7IIW1_PAPSO|nr:hypothetical protein C5167_040592 [Papaver somniferum]